MTERLPLQDSRRRGRYGWIRSFQDLLGRRKQRLQDASSILAVVNATEPVGHSGARNARLGHRNPQEGEGQGEEHIAIRKLMY
jgi:hypothetical protein